FETVRNGWYLQAGAARPLGWSDLVDANLSAKRPVALGRALSLVAVGLTVAGLWWAVRRRMLAFVTPLLITLLVHLLLTLAGGAGIGCESMLRYLLPGWMLLLLALGHQYTTRRDQGPIPVRLLFAMLAVVMLQATWQTALLARFLANLWVA